MPTPASHRDHVSRLRRPAAIACLAMAWLAAVPGSAAEGTTLDALFDQAMARYAPAGMAVGVIEDGKVVFVRTGGELRAGEGQPVDADTLFKIASTSKAMTAAVLGRLVDQGKLRWDDPVIRYVPELRMGDDWITRQLQVRDLLIHNGGFRSGAGDLMLWPEPNEFTRADIIAAMEHIRPKHGFRTHYGYSNLMYVIAGEVAARAGGKPYAQLVREELFQPLGMDRCQVGEWSRDAVGNVAQPHRREDGRNVVGREDGETIHDIPMTAAGNIRCSVNDMLTWMRAWLVPEAHPGWLSDAQRREMWNVQMPMAITDTMRDWDGTRMAGYGYGWRLSDVDGQWKVAHTGTLGGMYTSLVLLPDRRNGFIVLISGDGSEARTTLSQALVKHFTAPGRGLDVDHYADALARERDAKPDQDPTGAGDAPRRPVALAEAEAWLGTYRDPWFGDASLCPSGDRIVFRSDKSPRLTGALVQEGERWRLQWEERGVAREPWLELTRGPGGDAVLRMVRALDEAPGDSDFADLAFSRVGSCAP